MKTIDYTTLDPALAVLDLIRTIMRSELNTITLAEVNEIDKDKVSVCSLVVEKESNTPPEVFHNVPVFMMGNPHFRLEYPISVGDHGILLTNKLDMSEYRQTRKRSKTNLNRCFDKNDSIFIPLYYNSKDLTKEEVKLVYKDININLTPDKVSLNTKQANIELSDEKILLKNKEKINLECQGSDIELIADKVNLNCNELHCSPIKTAIDAIRDLMDSLASGMVGSGTNSTKYKADKLTKATDFDSIF